MTAPLSSLHTEHLAPLLERMQQGDREATDELIRRAGLRLEHLARRMLRRFPVVRQNVQTVDVLQETYLRLLNALREVRPENTRHFFALATRHVRQHLLDLVRRFRNKGHCALDDHAEPVAAGTGSAEVEELERWATLHEAVEALPDEEREVFGLRFYQGLTWPEIAGLVPFDERTARRRWSSACFLLRQALGGWVPAEEDNPGSSGQRSG
jgi:RNA polymerase sigma-70 factor (ECF subfamily)